MPEKVEVVSPLAPKAVGPYSQAIKVGNTVYLSGQIALDPKSGELSDPDVEGQTRRVLENIQGIMDSLGSSLASVVKVTVYLTSLVDFELMNDVYKECFPFCPPARTTVEVAALPKGGMVAMDAIAVLPS